MEDVEELKKVLFGNGRPGLCDRVTTLEIKTELNSKTMTKMDETVDGISKAVSEYVGAQKARSRMTNVLLTIIATVLTLIGISITFVANLI